MLSAMTRTLTVAVESSPPVEGVRLGIERMTVCALSEFPEHAIFDSSEMLACVRQGLRAPISGVAVLALDPHDVMRLVGRGSGAPDLSLVPRYLDLAGRLLAVLARPLARPFGREFETAAPELAEGALAPCLLATHPLPQTAVLACQIRLDLESSRLPGVAYLLLDPKLTQRVAQSLAA
ncbi:MAG: hypothetical protein ABFS46_07120 [Myxococcota bacterium]